MTEPSTVRAHLPVSERLKRAGELLDQAVEEIGDAIPDTELWAQDSLRFLKAEVAVSRRRTENVRRVLGSETRTRA